MTRYLLFFLTGFAHVLIILLYKEVSGGPASFYPILGMAGAVPLFAFASWLTLFSMRLGAVVALLSLLLLIPWSVAAVMQALQQDTALDQVIIVIHAILILFALSALITSARYTFRRSLPWGLGTPKPGNVLKVILALIPIMMVVALAVGMQWV
ncbi:hypothetical protein [Pontibacter ruber]|uniref:Uncharacterized protein n=1 Tax=Pontibacter ruber TaxID=1343895 RepID=A0ABW5CXY8_9BACT|nr:hypothetical protein [Pontibacter ruber]